VRLWHKDLIAVLPDTYLVRQWRDCCHIARRIAVDGTPRQALVNRVMDYPIEHFWAYARLVMFELMNRGSTQCNWYDFGKWGHAMGSFPEKLEVETDDIFIDWHNDRYFWQCYSYLEEQFECGIISFEDWQAIEDEACLKL
jgi:uncharacterized protein (TIGR02328 family)